MSWFRFKSTYAFLILATSACVPAASQTVVESTVSTRDQEDDKNASIITFYPRIYFADQSPAKKLEFSYIPDAGKLDIPFRSGKYAMINIDCSSFAKNGHLIDCDVTVEPEDFGYEGVAQKLARELLVDTAFVESLDRPIKFLGIQARIANSDVPATDGPCWPPYCRGIPLPPDPPPNDGVDDPTNEVE